MYEIAQPLFLFCMICLSRSLAMYKLLFWLDIFDTVMTCKNLIDDNLMIHLNWFDYDDAFALLVV